MSETCWQEFDDQRLVVASLLGEPRAYDELVRRYRGAVLVVAREIVGTGDEAEDVAQDALLVAFKALPQLREPSRFGPWLHAITRRRARRLLQQGRWRRTRLDELLLSEVQALTEGGDETRRWMAAQEVQQMLSCLSTEQRVVVELHYFEDLPIRRIGHFLSLPETTVKWRLHAAYQVLRRTLGREEAQHGKE